MRSTARVCQQAAPNGGARGLLQSLRVLKSTLALAIAVFLLGASSAAAKRLVIGASQTAVLMWIASERGYFLDQGLDVEVRLFPSGLTALNAVFAGDADLGTTAETPLVDRSFENPNIRIIATISASETSRLIARGDRGIKQPSDLKGKRVGVTLGSVGEYFLARYMILNGIPAAAFTMVDLTPEAIAEQLENGSIDAGLTWEPFVRNAETALEKNVVTLPRQFDQMYYFMLVTNKAWLEENPADARGIIRAVIQAESYAQEHPEAAKSIIQKLFSIPPDHIDYLWALHNLYVSLPQGLVFILERQAEWRIQKKHTAGQEIPDFISLVDTDPLLEIRASTVGIVK